MGDRVAYDKSNAPLTPNSGASLRRLRLRLRMNRHQFAYTLGVTPQSAWAYQQDGATIPHHVIISAETLARMCAMMYAALQDPDADAVRAALRRKHMTK